MLPRAKFWLLRAKFVLPRANFGLPRAKIWLRRAKFWLLLSLGCVSIFRLFTTKLDLLWAALFQFL